MKDQCYDLSGTPLIFRQSQKDAWHDQYIEKKDRLYESSRAVNHRFTVYRAHQVLNRKTEIS